MKYEKTEEVTGRIGSVIRNRRRGLGLSQAQLADRAGLHVNTVGAYERGEGQRVEGLVLIANALGLTFLELVKD